MHKHSFRAMNTTVQIGLSNPAAALDAVEQLFAKAEATFSRFRSDSELTRLNEHIGMETAVSPYMFEVLQHAAAFYHETGGIFQPGILPALEQAGYQESIEHIRGKTVQGGRAASAAIEGLPYTLFPERQSVQLHRRIDLSGIVKGWTVDKAAEVLEEQGSGFVNAGGDIRIFGTLPCPLQIGIEHPLAPHRTFASISIQSGALATSSTMKRQWMRDGEPMHHLIDPRTGLPAYTPIVSATVTAPTAMQADVWAKAALVLGETSGTQFITERNKQAIFMNCRGEIWRRDSA